ncbi:MAG: PH domain-containing protein [Candidatus Micrarchaeota archaeon]
MRLPRTRGVSVRLVWFLPFLAFLALIWLVAGASIVFLLPTLSPPPFDQQTAFAYLAGFTVVLAALALLIVELRYRHLTYLLGEQDVRITQGFLTRTQTRIPYDKIQNVRTETTVFERALGLLHAHIETAFATRSENEPKIPGIRASEQDEFIRTIMERATLAREGGKEYLAHKKDGETVHSSLLDEIKNLKKEVARTRAEIEEIKKERRKK